MLKTLIDIVIEASSLMLTDDFKITEKDGISNIVTSSDIAVQEFLRNRLSTLLPDSGFLCEEEDAHDLSHEYVGLSTQSMVLPIMLEAFVNAASVLD